MAAERGEEVLAFYGDPTELDRLAGRIRAAARQVWDQASTLSSRCAQVEWESAAADRFRGSVDLDVAALRRTVEDLEEAAAALEAHAETVRERIAAIARIEHAVAGWFGDQVRNLERLASRTAHAIAGAVVNSVDTVADAVVDRVRHPPWEDWQWTPDNLPPPGDKMWLEVGEFMARKGVL